MAHIRFWRRSAFAAWLLMNIMLVTVPVYGGYMMLCTGGLMLLTNLLYYMNIPSRPLVIRFEDAIISFSFGWSFWLVLAAGQFQTFSKIISIFSLNIFCFFYFHPYRIDCLDFRIGHHLSGNSLPAQILDRHRTGLRHALRPSHHHRGESRHQSREKTIEI